MKGFHTSNIGYLFLQVPVRFAIDHLNCIMTEMFDCHKKFPDIQVLELYEKLGAITFTGGSSQQQITRDDNIQHTMG